MGKKTQKIQQNQPTKKKLSSLKRNELNQLSDQLLKIGFKQSININEQWSHYIELLEVLDKVQLIENVLKVKILKNRRSNYIEPFLNWSKENDALFDGIKITEFPGFELGLQSTKNFKRSDKLLTIPKKMIMTEETLPYSVSEIFHDLPIRTMPNVRLALGLILERINPQSFWKTYIDLLPEKYTTVLYFTANEMQELKGSNCLSSALNQCKSIARQYSFIYKFIHQDGFDENNLVNANFKEKFSYELYRWAVSTVMTRQNCIPVKKNNTNDENVDESVPGLIPLWDFINYKEGQNTSLYNMELDCLESFSFADFKKGDQIFMHYGERSNSELLIHNGFISTENSKDSVSILLGLGNHDELYKEKSTLLDQLHIANNCELKVLPSPEFISPHLLGFIRIFNMNKDQLSHWLNSERANDLLHIDCALETSLESKAWSFLQIRLVLLLRCFPTTLEDDEMLLRNHLKGQTKLGHIRAMLITYRIFEKKILLNALEYAKQKIKQ